ncbi:hypothetical protein H6G10_00140 [Anabaena cylindrica FACHB-170]|uniref:Transposase n=1 Tax=Anabaena cylindrica FACHB-318 TaxID=2692880 RepID=A0ABR7ZGY0_ANACY|nr:hypothetical protein [Anabaena cylindrica]MBD2171765.1 hypothetical protein [Anabaena cylindrica FACHB-318]MBD2281632.1 hypothetical protein [Anabaena cylindrica FACHB-170]
MDGFPGLEQVALGIAHQNHEPVGNAHPTDTENFMCKRRLRQQKSNRIPIYVASY